MKDLFFDQEKQEKIDEQMKILLGQRTKVPPKADPNDKRNERFRGSGRVRRPPRR